MKRMSGSMSFPRPTYSKTALTFPSDRLVNMQRFRMETDRIIEFMEQHDTQARLPGLHGWRIGGDLRRSL